MHKDRLKIEVNATVPNTEEFINTEFVCSLNGVNQWKVESTHNENEYELLLYKSAGLDHIDSSSHFEEWANNSDKVTEYTVRSYHKTSN